MSIQDEIFARMNELSPAEKKVARTLLSDYPSAGLDSAARLAKAAGTSTPSVLRLLARIGIGSYPDFQARLRVEISHYMNSPVNRTEQGRGPHDEESVLGQAIRERIALVKTLETQVPPSEFDRAVNALADRPKHVVISGGYFTRHLAMLVADQLDQVMPNVDFVAEPLGHDIGKYLGLGKGSVAILLDFRRYEMAATNAAQFAKARGATVIVITDQGLSPATSSADIVLPVMVDGIPFDSDAGLIVLLEAFVKAVLLATGDRGIERMKEWEKSVHVARAYDPQNPGAGAPVAAVTEKPSA
ncbi:MAG TPA: MurR/RpiR family transcriptional regulator [Streptosporangiaceae bacterium]|jgi:DNA-binding MurR/RpiR family transcriptional regulator